MSTAILLINLGTPDSAQPKDVFRYLIEFLTDERVLDLPWLRRQLLVRGFIVPKRYKSSAKSYEAIWTKEGSPLMVNSINFKNKLQAFLGENFHVGLAMRYQNPSIESVLPSLLKTDPEHLIILPLFPQYASATTGSINQKVMEILKSEKVFPKITFCNHFFDHPEVTNAHKEIAASFPLSTYDHVVFSFHGLPKKQIPESRSNYLSQCYKMAENLSAALQLPKAKSSISFQSRLGKDPWLEPFTNETLINLAKSGSKRVLVFCPSFVCDCLETIFEIGVEYKEEFLHAGGEHLQLVPSLNDHPAWVRAASSIIQSCK